MAPALVAGWLVAVGHCRDERRRRNAQARDADAGLCTAADPMGQGRESKAARGGTRPRRGASGRGMRWRRRRRRAGRDDVHDEHAEIDHVQHQPPGTEPTAVEPIMEDLIARLDEVTEEIVREPSVVLTPDAPVLAELREVVTADEYEARLRVYRDNAQSGLVYAPLNADRIASATLAQRRVDRRRQHGCLRRPVSP